MGHPALTSICLFFFNCRQVGAPQPKAYTVKPLGHITLISIYFVIGSRAHTMNSLGYPAHTPKYILIHRLGPSSLVPHPKKHSDLQVGVLQPRAHTMNPLGYPAHIPKIHFNSQVGALQPKAHTMNPLGYPTHIPKKYSNSQVGALQPRAHTMNPLGYPAHIPKNILIYRLGFSSPGLIL